MPQIRLLTVAIIILLFMALFPPHAHAGTAPQVEGLCVNQEIPRKAIDDRHGRWITVTTDQWEFLRGIYVLNPGTPPGLPRGDRAVLAKIDGQQGGIIFFISGRLACTPMLAPEELLVLLYQVDAENVDTSEGAPL